VLTNHHVGADAIHKLSDASHDLLASGFAAATRAEERKCHDLELNVLRSIEDVTERVQAAVTASMTPDEAFAARRAVMAERSVRVTARSSTGRAARCRAAWRPRRCAAMA
jgi:hypothetical protein